MGDNQQLQFQCDLVMKGGIASGLVYPKAIQELSTKFRFRDIGGTSAGAIAAVVTAAAEHGRRHGKVSDPFKLVADIPKELSTTYRA
jgi:predicted acylesterase/phospholipase RssA